MTMDLQAIEDLAVKTLEDFKARDIQTIDISEISDFADRMIIATGTSTAHVKGVGNNVALAFKDAGFPALGVEAGPQPDWVLIDLGRVIIHVMTEGARAHYALEKLWEVKPSHDAAE